MSVPSIRRFALLLVFVPFLFIQCQPTAAPPPPDRHKCPGANPKRYKPEIKVDVSDPAHIKADPRVAVIWDMEPTNPEVQPFVGDKQKKVKITWTASDPNFELWIDLKGEGCGILDKDKLDCAKNKCTAFVKEEATKNVRCTYEMTNKKKTGSDEDADIIVMPCCP